MPCELCDYPETTYTHQETCARGIARSEDAEQKIALLLERIRKCEEREGQLQVASSALKRRLYIALTGLVTIRTRSLEAFAKTNAAQCLLALKDPTLITPSELACSCEQLSSAPCSCRDAGAKEVVAALVIYLESISSDWARAWKTPQKALKLITKFVRDGAFQDGPMKRCEASYEGAQCDLIAEHEEDHRGRVKGIRRIFWTHPRPLG